MSFIFQAHAEDEQKVEEKKIEFLLNAIGESNAIFIRNGDEHPAKKAKAHLEGKINSAKKMFWFFGPERKITVRDFIDKIASESSMSGKKYYMRFPGKEKVTTKSWLDKKLKEYEKKSLKLSNNIKK